MLAQRKLGRNSGELFDQPSQQVSMTQAMLVSVLSEVLAAAEKLAEDGPQMTAIHLMSKYTVVRNPANVSIALFGGDGKEDFHTFSPVLSIVWEGRAVFCVKIQQEELVNVPDVVNATLTDLSSTRKPASQQENRHMLAAC